MSRPRENKYLTTLLHCQRRMKNSLEDDEVSVGKTRDEGNCSSLHNNIRNASILI